jgi:capsular exopolysaccharide synthesis family protein
MFLLQKKEENEISITYNSVNTVIIEPPHGSGKPTSPKRIQVLLAALFLGILGPVTVIFLRASFDESVRDRRDVERNCDIPFLGEVPYAGREHSFDSLLMRFGLSRIVKSGGIVVGADMLDASNEAFRVLRNNMDASFAGNFLNEGGRSYLIKSTEIEVGKTFVAMNLALIRAIGGERVLFIDGDLRQASASRLWCAPLLGLTDFLNGDEEDYRKLLFHPEGYPMLDVLPAGALPTNPTELLHGPLLDQLLLTAKENYDCIFIDSPTSGMLADADIIERVVDCTMFVIRAGRFNRNQLNEISQIQATNSESKLQYIILNGVSIDARYGYTYLHKYERSEEDKNTVEISPKTILLNKIIFKKNKKS